MFNFSVPVLAAAGLTSSASGTAPPAGSGCSVVRPATAQHGQLMLLLQGTALTPQGVLQDAQILVVNGTITSIRPPHEHMDLWDLEQDDALAVIRCGPDAVISPGFINTHEHIEFSTVRPLADIGERVDHRHDWRVGLRGHTARPAPVNETAGTAEDATRWGELRHLLSGTTSIVGGQMVPGLVRNLDYADGLEEPLWSWLRGSGESGQPDASRVNAAAEDLALAEQVATWDVFPLGDAKGIIRAGDCDYGVGMIDGPSVARMHRYLAHVAEGVDDAALNEFRCLSEEGYDTTPLSPDNPPPPPPPPLATNQSRALPADMAKLNESTVQLPGHLKPPRPVAPVPGLSTDILGPNIGLVHALGVPVSEYPLLAARGASVVWSPRSNVFLYGKTLDIHALLDAGVNVALGTDWLPSGSASMSREAACARDVTAAAAAAAAMTPGSGGRGQGPLSARTIWEMMTTNAAQVAGVSGKLGAIQVGAAADIIVVSRPYPSSSPLQTCALKTGDDGAQTHVASDQCGCSDSVCSGHQDKDSYFAAAIYAEPADMQLILRGGIPLVIDPSLQDLVASSVPSSSPSSPLSHFGAENIKGLATPCEQVPYSDGATKILCLAATTTTTTPTTAAKAADQRGPGEEIDDDNNNNNASSAGTKRKRTTTAAATTTTSYAQLIRERAAQGVYPAFFPRGVLPEDEPSCVPTR
ncbi:uncharacterized protein B0I36DRAFT_352083 [Microdochium trichocladiopsis]|uniref:Amidohydrolase-related domain-containing protein n=1 Tax=Microdochium trichocladiopsis TaxID=1682393 RepID=A0A9P9BK23_9PEZI|nr:uncharacterized protein B0I36DRAFT_352083 [Microdochium trichocladiopsis]KAH7026184.1 hypothetical protein B0I36DRAFT_352083 [Microdochium trichocladiopsis]